MTGQGGGSRTERPDGQKEDVVKTGLSMKDLAGEILRQKASKKDLVAATPELSYASNGRSILTVKGHGGFEVTKTAHGQIADRLKIPKRFYDMLREENRRSWTTT